MVSLDNEALEFEHGALALGSQRAAAPGYWRVLAGSGGGEGVGAAVALDSSLHHRSKTKP